MATYYVTTGGSAGNTGLSPSTPWTLAKAFLSAVAGDIVYIAPGVYRGAFTLSNSGTSGSPIQFIGDPLASQGWAGISAGQVRITNISDDLTGTSAGATVINGSGRSWISFTKISFECIRTGTIVAMQISFGWSITQCQIVAISTNTVCQAISANNASGGTDMNLTFTRNVVVCNGSGIYSGMFRHTSAYGVTVNIKNCIFFGHNTSGESFGVRLFGQGTGSEAGGYNIQNCTFIGFASAVEFQTGNTSFKHSVTNSSFIGSITALVSTLGTSVVTEDYNRILAQTSRNGFPTGTNSSTNGSVGVEYGYNEIVGLPSTQMVSSIFGSPNTGFGTATNALPTDLFSNTWTGATPDAGAATYATLSSLGFYAPTERNASSITIAPGSTSQSIELYLGATGLTASTSGLSAYYNRTRSADVQITLQARNITQAWTSGGFAEVNPNTMPGVYRLDLPDAALAAGADDVTVVVRGASGTNGAVMTVKLSSGGLTSAQTASAVWGASPAGYNDATTFGGVVNQIDATVTGTSTLVQDIPSNVWQEQTDDHTTHGTFGYNILRADAPSKEGLVTLHQSGGISRIDADIHAVVNDTAAAAELKGALLHNGTDYISADLLTPVTSAQTVRIGPFAVRTDAGGADGALDLNQSTAGAVVVQLTDAQGTGIDQTSATVQAKVYNVAGGLVATYTCTPAYAVNGFMSIPMTTAVTGTAGSYIINLWSAVGATVIIYGPLQLRVRAI